MALLEGRKSLFTLRIDSYSHYLMFVKKKVTIPVSQTIFEPRSHAGCRYCYERENAPESGQEKTGSHAEHVPGEGSREGENLT